MRSFAFSGAVVVTAIQTDKQMPYDSSMGGPGGMPYDPTMMGQGGPGMPYDQYPPMYPDMYPPMGTDMYPPMYPSMGNDMYPPMYPPMDHNGELPTDHIVDAVSQHAIHQLRQQVEQEHELKQYLAQLGEEDHVPAAKESLKKARRDVNKAESRLQKIQERVQSIGNRLRDLSTKQTELQQITIPNLHHKIGQGHENVHKWEHKLEMASKRRGLHEFIVEQLDHLDKHRAQRCASTEKMLNHLANIDRGHRCQDVLQQLQGMGVCSDLSCPAV